MGNIVFVGSQLWFILELFGLCFLIFLYHRWGLLKRSNNRFINIAVLIGVFIAIIFSNFQYTSKDTTSTIHSFDTFSPSLPVEVKQSKRMTSDDAKVKLTQSIESLKQENQQ